MIEKIAFIRWLRSWIAYKPKYLTILFCLLCTMCYIAWQYHGFTVIGVNVAAKGSVKSEKSKARDKWYAEYLQTTEHLERLVKIKKKKRLPSIIGIGVEKCGTGALRWMLLHHPMIRSSDPPELQFFNTKKFSQGIKEYMKHMPETAEYELTFEKSPGYFNMGTRYVPQLMKREVPGAKIVVVLCDPVNRTISDFTHEQLMHAIGDHSFDATVQDLLGKLSGLSKTVSDEETIAEIYGLFTRKWSTHIISTGMYYYHLIRWYQTYDVSEIHIVDGEELLHDPGSAIDKLQEFLGIPKLTLEEDFVRGSDGFFCINTPIVKETEAGLVLQERSYPECVPPFKRRTRMGKRTHNASDFTMESLRRFYAAYNGKLFKLLGRKFNWQSPRPLDHS